MTKRVWFFTDPHIGVRSSSVEWMDMMEAYFRDTMLPLMKKEFKPGDICACLGDVFDSRNSINIRALNIGYWLFTELSKIFPETIIILGNHDVFNKSSNEINSVRFLSSIKGISVFEEPTSIQLGNKSVLLMPWRKDHEEEKTFLASAKSHDMLWCHADIRGATFNRRTVIEDGCSTEDFTKFDRVYTGHIHFRQTKNNVHILGTPYQLTRSDSGNPKGITLLDLETMEETFFENEVSPRFLGMTLDRILQLTLAEFKALIKNNFCDLYITAEEGKTLPVAQLSDYTKGSKQFQIWPDTAKSVEAKDEESDLAHDFSTETLIKEYTLNRKDLSDTEKSRMEKGLLLIMKQAEELIGKQ